MTMEVSNLQNSVENNYSSKNVVIKNDDENSVFLEEKLSSIQDEQGIIGKTFNGIKEFTGLGVSYDDCQSMVEKYEQGLISFDEAVEFIDTYDKKQSTTTQLITNVATGVGAIAVATTAMASMPVSAVGLGLAVAKGAPIGAALKTGIGILDRATNNVEDDAADLKQIAKDAISGSMTGVTSAISSGVGAGIKAGKIGLSILNGTKCGALCGGASAGVNYLTDVAFGDRDFKFGDLTKDVAFSSFVSGSVGAVVGAGIYGLSGIKGLVGTTGKEVTNSTSQVIAKDATASSLRKALGQKEKDILSA